MALRMTTAGLDTERVDVDPVALAADPDFPGMEAPRTVLPVVAGSLGDRAGGRRVIIAGHIDVVGPGDELQWTSPPFSSEIRDGALYGRGSVDMKGGVIAGLAAMRAVREAEIELAGEAVLLTVPAEEDGGAGALAAIRAGYTGDACVITDPLIWRSSPHRPERSPSRSRSPVVRRTQRFVVGGLCAAEARAGARGAREQRGRPQRGRDLPIDEGARSPLPHVVRTDPGGRVVVERARPCGGRRPVRRADRADGCRSEAELRAVVAASCRRRLAGRTPTRDRGLWGTLRILRSPVRPSAALVARRGSAGRARPAAGIRRDAVRVGRASLRRPRRHPHGVSGPGNPRLAHAPDEHIALDEIARCARTLAIWIVRSVRDVTNL